MERWLLLIKLGKELDHDDAAIPEIQRLSETMQRHGLIPLKDSIHRCSWQNYDLMAVVLACDDAPMAAFKRESFPKVELTTIQLNASTDLGEALGGGQWRGG